MHETSKSIARRLGDSRFATKYFVGNGIDIGAGSDGLGQYLEFFPLATSCRSWDRIDGDAELCETIKDQEFDFVHSSHCLEHMVDPVRAINNWIRILKPRGHLVILVPDEDMYEQGKFPSRFNSDHKHTFTTFKRESWSSRSINLVSLLGLLNCPSRLVKVETLDATFRYGVQRKSKGTFDQTLTPVAECSIEMVLQKL